LSCCSNRVDLVWPESQQIQEISTIRPIIPANI